MTEEVGYVDGNTMVFMKLRKIEPTTKTIERPNGFMSYIIVMSSY